MHNFLTNITIGRRSETPVYQQIAHGILQSVRAGNLKPGANKNGSIGNHIKKAVKTYKARRDHFCQL
jgi:hypothetical protein